jgi:TolA-binding protein
MSSKPSNWPLILIAVALTGAGVSYHFTLDSRFTALEQKLDQNSVALQQYQIAQETTISSKVAALNTLSKEVDVLQASLTPLGKVTKDQTDSLAEIRRQISSLGQLQQAQQDAQKKLADYAGQLEKIKHDIQMREAEASATAPPTPPSVPLPAPASTPIRGAPTAGTEIPSAHASAADVKPPVSPRTESSAVDLRPAEITVVRDNAARAMPVALPVDNSLSDNR